MLLDVATIRAFLDERHVTLAAELNAFARELARTPEADTDAAARVQARELMALMGSAKLFRSLAPFDLRTCCLVRDALGAVSPLADDIFALQALGSTPIALAGSNELRAKWVNAAMAGRAMAAFAMTEPEAGSDVANIQTRATRDGESYILNGGKTLISNAGIADFYTVFASTDPSAGHRGISCFVVEADAPGFEFVSPIELSSPHPLGDIRFTDCRIPASARLGEEGDGFKIGMATLDRLRPTVGAAACGMASRALDEALTRATKRKQFGKSLSEFQLIQEKLARMATELTASRLLVYRAGWEKDRGGDQDGSAGDSRNTLPAAMGKLYATEAAQRIIDDAMQILGGQGMVKDHPVERLYRAIRPLRIYEGTSEVQHLVIAKSLLRNHQGSR